MDHYYQTYHNGEVKDAGESAYTRFLGKYDGHVEYYKLTPLDPYSGYYQTYFEDVDYIQIRTDSNTDGVGIVVVSLVPGPVK